MRTSKIFKKLVTIVLALIILSEVQGQDWPGWRGENRDGIVKGFVLPEVWPDQLTRVWQQKVGLGDASVAFVGGKLFLNVKQDENETALCLDASTGNTVWSTVLNPAPEVTGGARTHPGPRSTPTVKNGKVYLIGAGGLLNCLDANTGKVIWKNENYTEVPVFFAAMSPLIVDGKCIAHLNGKENGTVVAFNADNGEIVWELKGEPSTYSSPLLMKVGNEEIIILQTETDVIGISKTGSLLWKVPTPGEQRFYNSSTPIIYGQNIIVCGQGKGTKSFKVEKSGDTYSVTENWVNPDFGTSFNTPILKDGYLYAHEARLGKLYCLNAVSGKTCWADTTTQNRFASTLDLGKVLLSLPAHGRMLFYEPNPEKYVQKVMYKISETAVYAHPLVVGNKIYTKDQETLTCWQVE
ncbi:MAG: serine/threonine protein kinase related [Prolixibacteraceae bacterium]|nr:MAG: serine/threonine protein kinase related [Prolixibacteraceae bacterium]